ncbi:MAG: C-GCAxxG-C-C family protein [Acutalibacteraceae bacterium]
MKKHSEKAAELFLSGCNCSQAVFGAFAEDCGIDFETALKLSSSFGGGMGKLRETCGAVTGMFMVAGLLAGYSDTSDKQAKDNHYKLIQELACEFKEIYKTYNCNELLHNIGKGTYISVPRTEEYYKTRPCVNFVITASEILDRHFFEN